MSHIPLKTGFLICLALTIQALLPISGCRTGNTDSAPVPEPGEVKWGHVQLTEGPMNKILLKDYQPASSLVVPENHPQRAAVPVIDVHTHVYAETPGEIREWVDTMDRVGIEVTVVLTGATGEEFARLTDLYLKAWPGRFQLYCGLLTEGTAATDYPRKAAEELEKCYKMGARGVGELVDKGWGIGFDEATSLPRGERLHPDDPRLDPFWDKCAELGLPVSLHVADHPSCWEPLGPEWERTPDFQVFNLYGKDVPSYDELLARRDSLLDKHRDTVFILCHLSNLGNNLERLEEDMGKHPNLYLDISARDYEIGRQPKFAGSFLKKHSSRVMFGTDMGRNPEMYLGWWRILETGDEFIPGRQWWRVYGLELDQDTLTKIYRGTAENTLNWN